MLQVNSRITTCTIWTIVVNFEIS